MTCGDNLCEVSLSNVVKNTTNFPPLIGSIYRNLSFLENIVPQDLLYETVFINNYNTNNTYLKFSQNRIS